MEYIVSHKYIPVASREMSASYHFNMWKRKLWPYRDLLPGDILYWYETPRQRIVWRTLTTRVVAFEYGSRLEAVRRLRQEFSDPDLNMTHWYIANAPEAGHCLAWSVKRPEKTDFPKPRRTRFPREGWLRVTDEIARRWLRKPGVFDDPNPDDLAGRGSLARRIRNLSKELARLSPERRRVVVSRMNRQDTPLVRSLKAFYEFRCQFPGCGIRIRMKDGSYYAEVAHVEPLYRGGHSILGNLVVLCPNHHKEFDYGDLRVEVQRSDYLKGTLNGRGFKISLRLGNS